MDPFLNEFYEDLFDDFINIPLNSFLLQRQNNVTDRRNSDIDEALRINQTLVDRVLTIRRTIENRQNEPFRNFFNNMTYFSDTGFFMNDDYLHASENNNYTSNNYTSSNDTSNNGASNNGTSNNGTSYINSQARRNNNRIVDEYYLPIYNNIRETFFRIYENVEDINNLEDVKILLNKNDFEKLKTIKIDNNNIDKYKESSCNVCLCNYEIEDDIALLPCNHYFHKNCIFNWLCKENVKCPICRKDCRELLNENNNLLN